jgi:NADH-quinone oxidoreductase subunit J
VNARALFFYLTAAGVLAATGFAITRRDLVHAVLYLILSFLGTAILFYLLAAPLLAVLHVIIYGGAIMVVFLLVVTAAHVEAGRELLFPLKQSAPAAVIAAAWACSAWLIEGAGEGVGPALPAAEVDPRAFGLHLFERHWLSVEIASLLLLVGVMAALLLARRRDAQERRELP